MPVVVLVALPSHPSSVGSTGRMRWGAQPDLALMRQGSNLAVVHHKCFSLWERGLLTHEALVSVKLVSPGLGWI